MTKIMESKFTACKQNTLSIVRVIWENDKDVMHAVKENNQVPKYFWCFFFQLSYAYGLQRTIFCWNSHKNAD